MDESQIYQGARCRCARWRPGYCCLNDKREPQPVKIPSVIERRPDLTPAVFRSDYLEANNPVVLPALAESWPAFVHWRNPDYLKQQVGPRFVEVMGSRADDARYEINCNQHREHVQFQHFVDYVFSGHGNNAYMTANNQFMASDAGRRLLQDITLPGFLNPADLTGRVFLWLGPAGTITPLHFDKPDILLCQVIGAKLFRLFPPEDTPNLYNEVGVFSEVDCAKPDYARFPKYRHCRPLDVLLTAGEAIFLPTGWWHYVVSLTPSISVSFTNLL